MIKFSYLATLKILFAAFSIMLKTFDQTLSDCFLRGGFDKR